MSAAKRKARKRDDSPSTRRDVEPTPVDLIRFCKQVRIDLDLSKIKAPGDYRALLKDLPHGGKLSDREKLRAAWRHGDREFREKLRAARDLWTYTHRVAAEVIEEGRTPREYTRDTRLKFRWLRSRRSPVPQEVSEEAKVQWEVECDTGKKISLEDKSEQIRERWTRWTRFKSPHQLRAALRRFGCPTELINRLSLCAVQKLRWLDREWVKAQNRERSKRRRPATRKTSA
jgi:hypothetical protein